MQTLTEYYPNGQLRCELQTLNGQLHGWMKLYNLQGQLLQKAKYLAGKLHGRLACYQDEQLQIVTNYKNGLRHGYQKIYQLNRTLVMKSYYQHNIQDSEPEYYDNNGELINKEGNNHEQ